jgi:hypothetical protein
MILKLTRNIVVDEDDEITQLLGCKTNQTSIRMDRVDGFSVEDDELVLIINGNEYFFEYDDLVLIELENYFKLLNTSMQ